MEYIFLITGLLAGSVIGWLFARARNASPQEGTSAAEKENIALHERIEALRRENENFQQDRNRIVELNAELARWKADFRNLEEKLQSQKAEMEELNKKLSSEFEVIANRLLEDKSKKFTEQNRSNLDIILNPLKEKISEFEKKVETAYKSEAAERNMLKGEIKSLVELNRQISLEAGNLAKALKGDQKMQGNWGEVILEKVLERSGLVKDREYKTQVSAQLEDGKKIQPDVVVLLPDSKHIIIDSKVSLVAYEAFINAPDENEKVRLAKEHIVSVKNHIRSLSEKNYQNAGGFNTPDFVLLFVPIEASFSLAVETDQELFGYAWDRKIVIVSPSTLLATLRTVASLWKQERQTLHALEIADQSGKLYDKFVGFMEDLTSVGKKMEEAQNYYRESMKKLYTGTGNLIRRAEIIRELGAKNSKALPAPLVERANNSNNSEHTA